MQGSGWLVPLWGAALSTVMAYVSKKVPEMVMVRHPCHGTLQAFPLQGCTSTRAHRHLLMHDGSRHPFMSDLRSLTRTSLRRTRCSTCRRRNGTAGVTGRHGIRRLRRCQGPTSSGQRTGRSCSWQAWCARIDHGAATWAGEQAPASAACLTARLMQGGCSLPVLRTLNVALGVTCLVTTLSILRLQWPQARSLDTAAMVRPPRSLSVLCAVMRGVALDALLKTLRWCAARCSRGDGVAAGGCAVYAANALLLPIPLLH